jgi:hypothetical protein
MADDRKRGIWQALRRRRAALDPVTPTVAPVPEPPGANATPSACPAQARRPGATEPPFVGPKTPPDEM